MNLRLSFFLFMSLGFLSSMTRAETLPLQIVSAKFGLIDYNKPGLRSGDFAIKETSRIPKSEKYFGWVVEVKCPPGSEEVKWMEITYLPGRYQGATGEDATVTVAKDLKSFTTRRTSICRNGIARIEDLYTREEGLPTGDWKIAVWSGKQLLAEFRFTLL